MQLDFNIAAPPLTPASNEDILTSKEPAPTYYPTGGGVEVDPYLAKTQFCKLCSLIANQTFCSKLWINS